MRPSLIIPRLRVQCASFSNRIGGAIDYESAQLAENLAVPCAFVISVSISPRENELAGGGVAQDVSDVFAVAVCVSNLANERGQDSAEEMHDLIDELNSALLAWKPSADHGPIELVGVDFSPPDRARLWAQISYTSETFITG